MVYNPSIGSLIDVLGKGLISLPKIQGVKYGRVVAVIESETEPSKKLYDKYGQVDSINVVIYKNIFDSTQEDELESLPYAYPSDSNVSTVPLVGEIVAIYSRPRKTTGGGDYPFTDYYTDILNLWGNPHYNGLPDTKSSITEVDLGTNVVEQENITGLHPFPGDTLIEGRLGQSIRLSGYNHSLNNFTDDSNNGKPFILLKAGQNPEYRDLQKYTEDVNKDISSIYLTTDHNIPVNPAVNQQKSFLKEDTPEALNLFKGDQILLDSGRIVLHSRTDSLFLNSKNSIALGSKTLNIDSTDYAALEAPEIYLGAKAEQPAVLGNSNEEFLRKLLGLLDSIGKGFNACSTPASTSGVLPGLGNYVSLEVTALINKLTELKSSKVKVE